MNDQERLDAFVRDALAAGRTRVEIAAALQQAGWPQAASVQALERYADVAFTPPVPRPTTTTSPREAFLYLVAFSTLYLSAWHFGSLLFHFVDLLFPDPAEGVWRGEFARGRLRWAVAVLLVAFPVFLLVSRQILRELDPARAGGVGRWLTWLTLFIATLVLLGNLATLIYQLLGGALTLRFLLKVLVVGIIAGGIFGYYLRQLRRMDPPEPAG
ncbi:MAG: hypothetical protein JJT88_15930 [Gammaproteobacteria bacterium]|nr:hypothetical protein [Gammaproteobacteria bacterium]